MRGLEVGDPSTRQRLVLALAGQAQGDAVSLAEAALNEPEPNVSGALYWALARGGDTAIPVLVQTLDSPDADRRRRAVEALEKIGSPQALTVLGAAFRHPDPFVAGRAALCRGAQGHADAIPALVSLVVDGRDDIDAADRLGLLAADDNTAQDILRAVSGELATASTPARRRLTAALAEIPGPAAAATLTTLVDDPDRGVALTAKSILVNRGLVS